MTEQSRYQQGRQELFGLLRQEHNVTCMDSDLDDIERCVLSYAAPAADDGEDTNITLHDVVAWADAIHDTINAGNANGLSDAEACLATEIGRLYSQIRADAWPEPDAGEDDRPGFKSFHASLCRRFGYTHDEEHWHRDLTSLEEHIAAQVNSAPAYSCNKPGDMSGTYYPAPPVADHWAARSPGLADQFRAEAQSVRKHLGFAPDANDVAPIDLCKAIDRRAAQAAVPEPMEHCSSGGSNWNHDYKVGNKIITEVADYARGWNACRDAILAAAPACEPDGLPGLTSALVNDAGWKFVEAMPHQLPAPIFNDLKPALYEAIEHYCRAAGLLGKPAPDEREIATEPMDIDAEYKAFCQWCRDAKINVDYRLHSHSGHSPSVGAYIRDEDARRMFRAWRERAKRAGGDA